jgi:hypothetical protein
MKLQQQQKSAGQLIALYCKQIPRQQLLVHNTRVQNCANSSQLLVTRFAGLKVSTLPAGL